MPRSTSTGTRSPRSLPPGVRRTLGGALVALITALLVTTGASAARAQGEALFGTLVNAGEPVPGVVLTITNEAGDEVEKVTTDDKGAWRAELPAAGMYTITVDTGSFPKGVNLRNPDKNSFTATVNPDQARPALFPLGDDTRVLQSTTDRALQLFVEGLKFGLVIAMAAIGLSLIFGTTGLTNFAHGELVTMGALIAYGFNQGLGIPLIFAGLIAVVVGGAAGGLLDLGLWRPLRRRGTGLIAMLVVSIGLSIFLRYLFQYIFGGRTRPYVQYQAQAGISIGPVDIAPKDLVIMILSVIIIVAIGFTLQRTRLGKATRAVADNPDLAASSGIDVERVINYVWIVGTALATIAGVFLGLTEQVSFQLGFQILLLVFAGVTLGGLGTAFGALVGSLVVGVFVQMSTLVISPELKNVGALLILILILLVRPQGILGRSERVG